MKYLSWWYDLKWQLTIVETNQLTCLEFIAGWIQCYEKKGTCGPGLAEADTHVGGSEVSMRKTNLGILRHIMSIIWVIL